MIIQVLGRALGMFFLVVFWAACIAALSYLMLRQSEEADFRFEVSMGKDINRVARELKEAGVDDKTVGILQRALQDIQQNTESYVNSESSAEHLLVLFLAMVFPWLSIITLGLAAVNRKNAMTNLSVARPRFAS